MKAKDSSKPCHILIAACTTNLIKKPRPVLNRGHISAAAREDRDLVCKAGLIIHIPYVVLPKHRVAFFVFYYSTAYSGL